jgi:Copper binding periplasmic protein CusF
MNSGSRQENASTQRNRASVPIQSEEKTAPRFKSWKTTMNKIAQVILVGAAALIGSAASAQQELTGTITEVDRINGVVAIRLTQSGTTGSNAGGVEEFKTPKGFSLDTLHASDRVTFSVSETGGVRTITKLQKQ